MSKSVKLHILLAITIILLTNFYSPLVYARSISKNASYDSYTYIYHYLIEIKTNSDWTTVNITDGPSVFAYVYNMSAGIHVPNLNYYIDSHFIWISKSINISSILTLKIYLISLKGSSTGTIHIMKGDIGSTNVTIYLWINGSYVYYQSLRDVGVNPSYPGTNDLITEINYEEMYRYPSSTAYIENLSNYFNKMVLAFYYPWYGTPNGNSSRWHHWINPGPKSIENAAHYPLLGIYDSWDKRLIKAHILLAKYAGIDGFIVSWWGIGSFEDVVFKRILETAEEEDFKVTIYYESCRDMELSEDDISSELAYIIRSYSSSKAFLKINGKPVIFIYNVPSSGRNPDFWLNIRRRLEDEFGKIYLIGDLRDPSYLNIFDGFHTYIELNLDKMKNLYKWYRDTMSLGLINTTPSEAISNVKQEKLIVIQDKLLFYTVIAGYDDRKIRTDSQYIKREGGNTFREAWENAISVNAENILITSWNELHEGTEIEPTREYGFLYINLTRHYIEYYSGKDLPTYPETSENFSIHIHYIKRDNYTEIIVSNQGNGYIFALNLYLIPFNNESLIISSKYIQPSAKEVILLVIPLICPRESIKVYLTKLLSTNQETIDIFIKYYSFNGNTFYKLYEYPASYIWF